MSVVAVFFSVAVLLSDALGDISGTETGHAQQKVLKLPLENVRKVGRYSLLGLCKASETPQSSRRQEGVAKFEWPG